MKILFLLYQVWQLLLFSVFLLCIASESSGYEMFYEELYQAKKTALETKGASKNRAEKDYEVVDLGVTENTETKFPNYRRQLNNG